MKVVYIAAPYRADTISQIVKNIEMAKDSAIQVWVLGHVALCPHMNSALLDGVVPDNTFLEGSLELMKRSDIVYCPDHVRPSEGVKQELHVAKQLEMPVYFDYRLLKEHLRGVSYE